MSRPQPKLVGDKNATASKKRVNWEVDSAEIVRLSIHCAVLGEKPGEVISRLIREHLRDISWRDERQVRETRASNKAKTAGQGTPLEESADSDESDGTDDRLETAGSVNGGESKAA